MTGSLCFYIINHKGNQKLWLEYWMLYEELLQNVIIIESVEDCKTALEYFDKNRGDAFNRSKRGFELVHEILEQKNVLLYWKILLEKYSSKFLANEQIYFVPFVPL